MQRTLVVAIAVAAFLAGWVAHDLTDEQRCRESTVHERRAAPIGERPVLVCR